MHVRGNMNPKNKATAPETAEIEREKSQKLLDDLTQLVPGILFQTRMKSDGTFVTTYASERSYEIYELSPQEILADNCSVFGRIHPEDRERFFETIHESARDLKTWKCDYRVLLPRQGLKWLEGTAQPAVADDGTLVWHGIVMDVTERKQTAEQLRFSEEKFSRIFRTSPDAIFVSRCCDGRYLDINDASAELTGYSKNEILSVTSQDLNVWVDPAERQRLVQLVERNGAVKGLEARLRRKDGSILTIEISACQVLIHGEPCLLSIVRDITEHKTISRALQDSEENLRIILDSLPVAIAITDGIRIQYLNRSFVDHFGYDLEEIPTDYKWFQRAYPEQNYRNSLIEVWTKVLEQSRREGIPIPFMEVMVTCKDGTVRHTLANTRIIHGDRIAVIFTDITEREMVQKELLKVQKLESLGVLAGGIAHDFNNILTAVVGNVAFAKLLTEGSDRAQECLDKAENACMRAADLARQLLVFAKGGQPVKMVVSLRRIIEESASLVFRGTNVRAILDVDSNLHAIEADECQISQSLHNIIINAVQAMPEGGTLTVRARNEVITETGSGGLPAGDYAAVSFTDTGYGISSDDQRKIFDPYFTTKAGGSGLGLASTYSVIKNHSGQILVESTIGKGTTFTIYLPSAGEAAAEVVPKTQTAKPDGNGYSVLVMDDDEMVTDLASRTLRQGGYAVTSCANGDEAVARYVTATREGKPFSVVILDLTVPGGMGGVDAARRILAVNPHARVVVSSGYSDDPVMANYRAYGFIAAIAKPYKPQEIFEVLGQVIGTDTP